MSDFDRVKQSTNIRQYADNHLKRQGRMHVCPKCGSGTGPNGTPAFSIWDKDSSFKCFSCQVGGDIFDLAGIIHKTEDKNEQLRTVATWAGITISEREAANSAPSRNTVKAEPAPDYSEGIKAEAAKIAAWASNIDNPEAAAYIEKRGFTVEQAKAWGFGYDPQRKRLVIPYRGSKHYHIDRDITGKSSFKYEKPKSEAVGKQPFENPEALKSDVLFIAEGLFDAFALEACGFESTALNGTAWREPAAKIVSSGYKGIVIVALDNDEAGQKAAREMTEHLHSAGISARLSKALETLGCKDAGDAYTNPEKREKLKDLLEKERTQAIADMEQAAERAYNEALKGLSVKDPMHALDNLITLADIADPIPTGFQSLDAALNGGLRNGLTVLGALSSMGKTTFMLQIADQIAASGHPVLYVTIEQSVSELVSKSASRLIAQGKPATGARYGLVSSQDIRTKDTRLSWNESQTNALYDAYDVYKRTIAPNTLFLEGTRQPSVEGIHQAAEAISRKTGKYPVVFVDYLQLLSSPEKGMTDKQAVDQNVSDLRIMAKDKMPVFIISSLNRESYSGLVEMTSFKESGAIEYSSDVLLGLQPAKMKKRLMKKNKSGEHVMAVGEERKMRGFSIIEEVKSSTVRDVELLILKNRDGKIVGNEDALQFSYRVIPNLFEEK